MDELNGKLRPMLEKFVEAENYEYQLAQILQNLRTYDFEVPRICLEDAIGLMVQKICSSVGLYYSSDFRSNDSFQAAFMERLTLKNSFYEDKNFDDFMRIAEGFAKGDTICGFMLRRVKEVVDLSDEQLRIRSFNYIIERYARENNQNVGDLDIGNFLNSDYFAQNVSDANRHVLLGMLLSKMDSEGKTKSTEYASVEEFDAKVHDYARKNNVIYFNSTYPVAPPPL